MVSDNEDFSADEASGSSDDYTEENERANSDDENFCEIIASSKICDRNGNTVPTLQKNSTLRELSINNGNDSGSEKRKSTDAKTDKEGVKSPQKRLRSEGKSEKKTTVEALVDKPDSSNDVHASKYDENQPINANNQNNWFNLNTPKLDHNSQLIFDYMRRCNRPFGTPDITRVFSQALTRSQVNKAVDSLLEKSLLRTNEKRKIFWINQNLFRNTDSPSRENNLPTLMKTKEEENKLMSSKLKNLTEEVDKLKKIPSNSELSHEIERLHKDNKGQSKQLGPVQSDLQQSSNLSIEAVHDELKFYKNVWKQRRTIVDELILDMIDSGSKKETKSSVYDKIGIESDESHGVSLKDTVLSKTIK